MFTNHRRLQLIAKKNAYRWNLVKFILKSTNAYSKQTLESKGTKTLERLVAELKGKKARQ